MNPKIERAVSILYTILLYPLVLSDRFKPAGWQKDDDEVWGYFVGVALFSSIFLILLSILCLF